MKKMTKNAKPADDLMLQILDLQHAIYRAAEAEGLARYLMDDGRLTVEPEERNDGWSADIFLSFKPNHGITYKLMDNVTARNGAWPIDRDELTARFIAHLRDLYEHSKEASASRRAIKTATLRVIAEAAQEGISLELLDIEAASTHVRSEPGGPSWRPRFPQVFYVNILMPHIDAGTLTEDTYVMDANDADEFASYLRERVLLETRQLLAKSVELVAA